MTWISSRCLPSLVTIGKYFIDAPSAEEFLLEKKCYVDKSAPAPFCSQTPISAKNLRRGDVRVVSQHRMCKSFQVIESGVVRPRYRCRTVGCACYNEYRSAVEGSLDSGSPLQPS